MRARLCRLWLLVRHPERWSAAHYARKSQMHFAALHADHWRQERPR